MKKAITIAILFILSILFIVIAIEAQEYPTEFSVRFHSKGKNTTINLKEILGPSEEYFSSETKNIIVKIDQKRGLAYIEAKPNWEGTETIFFSRLAKEEDIPDIKLNEIKEKKEPQPFVSKEQKTKIVEYKKSSGYSLPSNFFNDGVINKEFSQILKNIEKEPIIDVKKVTGTGSLELTLNDEVNILIKKGQKTQIKMDFSLNPKKQDNLKEESEIPSDLKKNPIDKIILGIIIIITLSLIGWDFYINEIKKENHNNEIEESEDITELEPLIDENLKKQTYKKLSDLQKLVFKERKEAFFDIIKEFFSIALNIEYTYSIALLLRKVKRLDIDERSKTEIINFLEDISNESYFTNKRLNELIKKMRRLIERM